MDTRYHDDAKDHGALFLDVMALAFALHFSDRFLGGRNLKTTDDTNAGRQTVLVVGHQIGIGHTFGVGMNSALSGMILRNLDGITPWCQRFVVVISFPFIEPLMKRMRYVWP